MKKPSRKPRSLRTGFSLTELIIVMAILVLIVSLVGPRILGSKKKADVNSVKTQIGLFNAALERYAIDMNKFPSTEQGLSALVSEPSSEPGAAASEGGDLSADPDSEDGGESQSNWDGPYLKSQKLPKDPWGKAYRYEYPPKNGKGDQPDIWSLGPDGQENTEDDIVSWVGGGTGGSGGGGDVLDDPVE